ncbi:argininosuccinate lyase [Streptococcus orisratti]|uniref:argininosuccinate lyase n=1 Tax=Streptococcus orisratti TaxID=114652 RepID=UPI002943AF3B|nr:argininosuccinate lyase [Streptococcus orisratti]
MELVLPNNCVALEQEEMMYLDGGGVGKHWWNKRDHIAAAAVSGGMSVYQTYAVKKLIANRGMMSRVVRSAITKYIGGVSAAAISNALNIAATVAEVFSLGGAIAYGLDKVDVKFDGYLWA